MLSFATSTTSTSTTSTCHDTWISFRDVEHVSPVCMVCGVFWPPGHVTFPNLEDFQWSNVTVAVRHGRLG